MCHLMLLLQLLPQLSNKKMILPFHALGICLAAQDKNSSESCQTPKKPLLIKIYSIKAYFPNTIFVWCSRSHYGLKDILKTIVLN